MLKYKLTFILFLTLFIGPKSYGDIPEPGNIIYGTVTYGGQIMTSADSEIEVSLKKNGMLLTSYRMGQKVSAGNYYVLKVPMDLTGAAAANVARPGDTTELYIGTQFVEMLTIGERGSSFERNLSVDKICESTESGALLSAGTYSGQSNCGNPGDNFIITDGNVVT